MAYKEIILHSLYMPSYFLGAFTEYPKFDCQDQPLYFRVSAFIFSRSSGSLELKLLKLHFCKALDFRDQ